jgi:hypothetical protein
MTKYILTVDTFDRKTHSFECDLCTEYDDDMLTYADFWDQHHPITNDPGMSSKDYRGFATFVGHRPNNVHGIQ